MKFYELLGSINKIFMKLFENMYSEIIMIIVIEFSDI